MLIQNIHSLLRRNFFFLSIHLHSLDIMTSRLVLVIGDLHIPDRAIDIPAKVPNDFLLTLLHIQLFYILIS